MAATESTAEGVALISALRVRSVGPQVSDVNVWDAKFLSGGAGGGELWRVLKAKTVWVLLQKVPQVMLWSTAGHSYRAIINMMLHSGEA